MSKKKTTHEQAFEDLQKIVEVDQRVVGMYEVKYLRDYITQQEKQDKYTTDLIDIAQHRLEQISLLETKLSKKDELLKLSLKLNDVWKNRHQYTNSVSLIEELEQQIKELENE